MVSLKLELCDGLLVQGSPLRVGRHRLAVVQDEGVSRENVEGLWGDKGKGVLWKTQQPLMQRPVRCYANKDNGRQFNNQESYLVRGLSTDVALLLKTISTDSAEELGSGPTDTAMMSGECRISSKQRLSDLIRLSKRMRRI